MPASDEQVLAYLRANGLMETFAAAAGVAKSTPTVGEVHAPAALGDDKKKPGPVVVADVPEGIDDKEAGEVVKDLIEKVDKIGAADPVFFQKDANLYVSRPLTSGSADRLHAWAEAQGIPNLVPPDLMHVTQVHSKADVDTSKLTPLSTLVDVGQDRWVGPLGDKGAVVMFFQSPELAARHVEAKDAGASWDFPTFMPHVTLSYDAGDHPAKLGMVPPPTEPLQLGPEEFKASDDSWVENKGLRKGDFTTTVKVAKVDEEQQLIFGWASVSMIGGKVVIDKQGDIVPVEEIEKAAYDYTLWSRTMGEMHSIIGTGNLIESCVFTPEKAALGLVAKNEQGEQIFGWWTGFHVSNPETWDKHKRGELPEFSIGGRAIPEEVA